MADSPLVDDSWYQRPERVRTRYSAGGIVVRREGDEILVALTREGALRLFVLPKGGIERGEDALTAARREIAEEAGLTDIHLLADLGTRERCGWKKNIWIITHFYLFSTTQIKGVPTDYKRHFGVWWYPIQALPEMLWPDQRRLIESNHELIERLMSHE